MSKVDLESRTFWTDAAWWVKLPPRAKQLSMEANAGCMEVLTGQRAVTLRSSTNDEVLATVGPNGVGILR